MVADNWSVILWRWKMCLQTTWTHLTCKSSAIFVQICQKIFFSSFDLAIKNNKKDEPWILKSVSVVSFFFFEGNNNQQLTGANHGDGPSKPKKGRPRAGAPGHRYSQPCPTCGKVFGSSSALAKHKLIHSSERRHKCILCAKSFKRQDHLWVLSAKYSSLNVYVDTNLLPSPLIES